jgi:lipoprotein-releasing system ATP-binding protein
MSTDNLFLRASNLYKRYGIDGQEQHPVTVLTDVSIQIDSGETVAITGASGCGKSTLLHLLAGLDGPDAGSVTIDGLSMFDLDEAQRCLLRNQKLGFIYQFHHLLKEFNALENVALPLRVAGLKTSQAQTEAYSMLTSVGLADRARHYPNQLSGGERQRVAIARALVHLPRYVLADEPTGNLDEVTADEVSDLLFELSKKHGIALVLVTHNRDLASRASRQLTLSNGLLTFSNGLLTRGNGLLSS